MEWTRWLGNGSFHTYYLTRGSNCQSQEPGWLPTCHFYKMSLLGWGHISAPQGLKIPSKFSKRKNARYTVFWQSCCRLLGEGSSSVETVEARDSDQVWTGAGAGGEEYFITGNPHDFNSGHKSSCSYQVLLYFLLNFSMSYKIKKLL